MLARPSVALRARRSSAKADATLPGLAEGALAGRAGAYLSFIDKSCTSTHRLIDTRLGSAKRREGNEAYSEERRVVRRTEGGGMQVREMHFGGTQVREMHFERRGGRYRE